MWNQIKHISPSSSESSPTAAGRGGGGGRRFQQPASGTEGPLKVLSPMSEQDAAELLSQQQAEIEEAGMASGRQHDRDPSGQGSQWQRRAERAITNLSAEVAALREQITTGREWRSRRERSVTFWMGRLIWAIMKHLLVDSVVLSLVLLWMRKTKDRRLEDLVRAALSIAREYARTVLPSR